MRTVTIQCEMCGRERPRPLPPTWWLLEEQGAVGRTAPLDFCSFACLRLWLDEPEVRQAYREDFVEDELVIRDRLHRLATAS